MHHFLVHTNQDIKRRQNRGKDSTVHTTEYWSKVKPSGAWPKTWHQVCQNRHRVWGPTRRRAIKEESKVGNHIWVDHQACSLSQYIIVITNMFYNEKLFNKLRWKVISANIFFVYTLLFSRYKTLAWKVLAPVSDKILNKVLHSLWYR